MFRELVRVSSTLGKARWYFENSLPQTSNGVPSCLFTACDTVIKGPNASVESFRNIFVYNDASVYFLSKFRINMVHSWHVNSTVILLHVHYRAANVQIPHVDLRSVWTPLGGFRISAAGVLLGPGLNADRKCGFRKQIHQVKARVW